MNSTPIARSWQKHGVDWRQVRQLVTDAKSGEDKNAFVAPLERIIDRVPSKAELYAEVNDFFSKASDPPPVTVLEMKKLVQKGSTARCEALEKTVVTETFKDASGTRKARREVQAMTVLFFHRIDGLWRLDVDELEQ